MNDLSYGVSIILLVACLFTYFQTGSVISLVCFLLGVVLMSVMVFGKEPQQSLQDAKKEGMAALVDLAAGIGAGHNPIATGVAAVSAAQHLSAALDHLREGDAEARRRREDSERQAIEAPAFVERDMCYEPDRSAP